MKLTKAEVKEQAERDLYTFAVLNNPTREYGPIHQLVFKMLESNLVCLLLLLPRSHMKSHCIAVWVAWWITKHPYTTVMYVSATEGLALKQVYAIKQILESDVYRRYWPEMVHPDEAKREKWTATEIIVDHPLRKLHGVRDATLMAASIGKNTTGLHCEVLVYDDIVVPENAYTEGGRQDVQSSVSMFDSILNPGGIKKAVGTRYHPKDVYGIWLDMEVEQYDDEGNMTGTAKVWKVYERPVHDETGAFLWPRTYSTVTKQWYGFDLRTLAAIRATYVSMGHRDRYHSQYFNDPNFKDGESGATTFYYYAREKLREEGGQWLYMGSPLAIYLGGDFAYTTSQRSDFTAYGVIGVTQDNMKLILDLAQFKTSSYEVYFAELLALQKKWGFRRGKLEVNGGANVIANYIESRLREENVHLVLEVKAQSQNKSERTAAILTPEYDTKRVLHFKGGWMNEYEDQLTLARPAHDDLRDAVTIGFEIAKPPSRRERQKESPTNVVVGRFGGRR